MSQEKAQLIAPIDSSFTVPGVTVSGVITATSFDGTITGVADSITQGKNLNVGVVTALSFSGNLTGNAGGLIGSPNTTAGVVTATSFVGDLSGNATSLTGSPNLNLGVTTASSFVGAVTGNVVGDVTGDAFSASVSGITTSNNISVGVVTSTDFRGEGSTLDGLPAGLVTPQYVGFTSAATTIDLSNGNLIYVEQSANTTVSFANSTNGYVYLIRTKDDNSTARTISWPTGIGWSGGSAPTLVNNSRATDAQVFSFVTRDEGVTWDAKEVMRSDPQTFGMFMWGQDHNGKLGLNESTGSLSSPTQIPGSWSTRCGPYSQGDGCVAAVKTDGTLWSWGYDGYGQSGHNDTVYRSSPMQIGTDTTWAQGTTGYRCSYAVKTDGTLWSWGNNESGELGINDRTKRSSPTQIGSGTDWYRATGNRVTPVAFKTDGTMYTWGSNSYGRLGLNQTGQGNANNCSSPTQIPGTWNADASHHVGGAWAVGAIKTDGTLWVWGMNQSGDLGTNKSGTIPQGGVYYSSPTQVGTDTTWAQISQAPDGGLAVKTDGTLWAWGRNVSGQLAQNTAGPTTSVSSPTQIGTDTNWSTSMGDMVKGGRAIKTDGTAWVWGGQGGTGTLGLNQGPGQLNSLSSPTQLSGTWSQIQYSSSYNMMGFKPI